MCKKFELNNSTVRRRKMTSNYNTLPLHFSAIFFSKWDKPTVFFCKPMIVQTLSIFSFVIALTTSWTTSPPNFKDFFQFFLEKSTFSWSVTIQRCSLLVVSHLCHAMIHSLSKHSNMINGKFICTMRKMVKFCTYTLNFESLL